MNRIILIGNGFDKAHGLKTGYDDFMKWYQHRLMKNVLNCHQPVYDDGLYAFKVREEDYQNLHNIENLLFANFGIDFSFQEMIKYFDSHKRAFSVTRGNLINRITKSIEEKKWVDIENDFYTLLSGGNFSEIPPVDIVSLLNKDLLKLREFLMEYLLALPIESGLKNKDIRECMFEPVLWDDIAVGNVKEMISHVRQNFNSDDFVLNQQYKLYCDNPDSIIRRVRQYKEEHGDIDPLTISDPFDRYFSFPQNIMLLNFNYTETEQLYYQKGSTVQVNHIHGTITDPSNTILGYGDELDSKYKKILELNENEYLKNMKSCHYLESGRYREMLSFVESAPYQVYIMGHSCGNSDRTLLNTLFEHRHCVSIKPFYYEMSDGRDNYIEIVQNISRVFTDMQLMRDRVVNKERCKPLPQN